MMAASRHSEIRRKLLQQRQQSRHTAWVLDFGGGEEQRALSASAVPQNSPQAAYSQRTAAHQLLRSMRVQCRLWANQATRPSSPASEAAATVMLAMYLQYRRTCRYTLGFQHSSQVTTHLHARRSCLPAACLPAACLPAACLPHPAASPGVVFEQHVALVAQKLEAHQHAGGDQQQEG